MLRQWFGNPTLISGFIKSWLHSLQIVEVCKTREIKKYWRHRKTTSSAKVKWLCSCFIWSTFLSIFLIHAAQSAFPIVNLQVAIIFIHSQIQMLFFKQQNQKKKNNPQTSDNPPHLFNRANYRKSLIELSCCQEKHAVNCSQHFLPFQAFWTLRNAMKFLFWSIPSKQYWVQKVYEEFLQSITFNATLIIKWFYKTRCFPDWKIHPPLWV